MSEGTVTGRRLVVVSAAFCAMVCAETLAHAGDSALKTDELPSAWIVELGGYGVFEPTYLGSRAYTMSFKPIVDVRPADSRDWLGFPNDAFGYSLYETSNFRAGPALNVTFQSRLHGEDIDLNFGKADVTLQAGTFAEYYPRDDVRTRIEILEGIAGNGGLAVNLSADYIYRPAPGLALTFGPRAQVVDDQYASQYFSTQLAYKNNNNYVPYHAEGGLLTSGAEFTSNYEFTKQITTKFFLDYNQLMGDAADSPRVNLRGSAEQVIVGVGATYKFAVEW